MNETTFKVMFTYVCWVVYQILFRPLPEEEILKLYIFGFLVLLLQALVMYETDKAPDVP